MKSFFKVKSLEEVLCLTNKFSPIQIETIPVSEACSRVLAQDILSLSDMPGFRRATMDGYAVVATDTFGASESNPTWLEIAGTVGMGDVPDFNLSPGKAARISTGGMLPKGADAVVMVEHSQTVDEFSVEIYKSVAPLQHVIDASEDFSKGEVVVSCGTHIRPQEQGLIAGLGVHQVQVYQQPKVGIISSGDEIIPIDQTPVPGKIRDINSYTLSGFVKQAGAEPIVYGIVKDDPVLLNAVMQKAVEETDMVMISGGSSVGTKDYTIEVLSGLPDTQVLVHGISISPGKPTILAKSGRKPIWGLPGQVTSAMVVMKIVVIPFLDRLKGLLKTDGLDQWARVSAQLTRNVSSTQGRKDFIRVKLVSEEGILMARPILGKSGLIRTMVHADGLLEIDDDVEGLEKDSQVNIILL